MWRNSNHPRRHRDLVYVNYITALSVLQQGADEYWESGLKRYLLRHWKIIYTKKFSHIPNDACKKITEDKNCIRSSIDRVLKYMPNQNISRCSDAGPLTKKMYGRSYCFEMSQATTQKKKKRQVPRNVWLRVSRKSYKRNIKYKSQKNSTLW